MSQFTIDFSWNKANKSIKSLRDMFDKQIAWAPQVKVLYVKPKDFEEILKIIPDEIKKHLQGNPQYKGYEIKKMGEV